MHLFKRISHFGMDLNARVDINCGRKDGRTKNRTPISHLAKAGATKRRRGREKKWSLNDLARLWDRIKQKSK